MRKTSLGLVTVLATLLTGIAAPATAVDHATTSGKTGSQLACEKACHEGHGAWVDECLYWHNPLDPGIWPKSARGHCVDFGAERLRQCLAECR